MVFGVSRDLGLPIVFLLFVDLSFVVVEFNRILTGTNSTVICSQCKARKSEPEVAHTRKIVKGQERLILAIGS